MKTGVIPSGHTLGRGKGTRRTLLWLMWVLLGLYLGGLLLDRDGFSPLVNVWIGVPAAWAPAAVAWLAAYRAKDHWALALVAMALSAFAAGSTYYVAALAGARSLPFPSPADTGYLLFYPLALGGLFVYLLPLRQRLARSVLLDAVVGSLGAATVLVVLLSPLLSAAGGFSSLATAVAVAYPLLDLIVLAVTAGMAAVPGLATGRSGATLMLGLMVFAAADVVYASRLATDTYVLGTPLDAGWTAGLCLIAAWADGFARQEEKAEGASEGSWTPAVPMVATAAGLGVLIVGTGIPVPELAVGLAAATLVSAGIRTQLAFRQLVTLAEVRRQARTDELTGLPNRRALYTDAPAVLDARQGAPCAFLLLDADRFKEINDSLGHDVGDRLLVQVSERLRRCLGPGDLIARLGGDEFAILLLDAGEHEALQLADRLRAALSEPLTLRGIALQVGVSVGIALFPEQGEDLKTLLRKADTAMYRAKTSRSGSHVYASEDHSPGEERLRMLQELRAALIEDQLVLHYQPKVDALTGETKGVEALVRWNHPRHGLLAPGSFLLLAEEGGLMNALNDRVLTLALDQAAIWHSQGRPMTVAANLSASSLIDAELPDRIAAMIKERGLAESALMVEITEDFMMPDRVRARDILSGLQSRGIRVAIDDFGTGYSSLAYLRDLPINELKLDRSFIVSITEDPRAAALVASTINLAHSLGLTVVAEGVEDGGALDQLGSYGCDQAQGFHILRPVPAAELDDWFTVSALDSGLPSA
ncbi:bifunctional diguanylate cyclase/phosphodiesterase [Arthrobacter sp. ISL-65]|uniref:putative bifunctional diguanylate cyclase/phosphodiesterase n=1 Tax=Arthrobacter sp. ISL-65 TaxID=2819112 RepID=UPI001BECB0AB|nr:EAL domain-containing protein [Arthrobacter sp. ISL-65]MBT2548217.1 EAL domain-containing protein [Arthrobacter sp. ISL-65]